MKDPFVRKLLFEACKESVPIVFIAAGNAVLIRNGQQLQEVSIADVPIGLMYKASLPYVVGLFVCVGLIVAFPQLSLWLPSMMH